MAEERTTGPESDRQAPEALSEQEQQLQRHVVRELAAGSEPAAIQQALEKRGLSSARAAQLVERTRDELQQKAEAERIRGRSLILGVAGGLAAAALGAIAWAHLCASVHDELRPAAWAMGGLCGLAVMLCARPARGWPLQLAAVLATGLGILGSKYGLLVLGLGAYSDEIGGTAGRVTAGLLQPLLLDIFFHSLGDFFTEMDLLWVGLAVLTAWLIPSPRGLRQRPGPNDAGSTSSGTARAG
jgi:hypothetical protein